MVEVHGLTMRFGTQLLFEDINLSLDKGNRYGLIGANGAGKSTFLKILSGEIEASSGEVLIDSGLKVGVLGQDQFAFENFSLKDAVLYGNKRLYDAVKEKEKLYLSEEFTDEINERLGELEMITAEEELIGSFCISGFIEIYEDKIALIKNKIQTLKKELNLKKVTSLMLCANPFHRVHERLIRLTIDKADFLIIFLLRSTRENRLNHALRKKTIEYFINNFLPKDKVLLIDLENTTLFSAHKNPELECIAAYNFGANKIIIGQNHGSIGMFFDDNQAHTIIDKIRKNFNIEILVMPEYVYCNECKTIVSVKTCPHGQHHHIKYHSPTIRTLLLNGVLPPPILMRKEISSIILSDLFPNRFENLQQIYDEIFPNAGILETHTYEDFYKELAKLYQTGSLT